MAKVRLSEIVDAIEMQSDELRACFDRHTGKVAALTDEELRAAEKDEDLAALPDWQAEQIALAKEFLAAEGSGRFVALPDRFEVNEWEMMRDFAAGLDDEQHADALLNAIHGPGAFRYFKDRIHELGLADAWYAFRQARYREIALDWCHDHDIEVDEKA